MRRSTADPNSPGVASGDKRTHAEAASTLRRCRRVACRNAKGKSAPDEVLSGIWSDFVPETAGATPSVRRADGTEMKYWGEYVRENTEAGGDARSLIEHADGRCGGWADFLVEVLKVQGILAEQYAITAKTGTPPPKAGLHYVSTVFDVSSLARGQGNATPIRRFSDHAVVQLVGASAPLAPTKIFDPSYGSSYNGATIGEAELAWESASIARFLYKYSDGSFEPWANTAEKQVDFTPPP
jgi:hypothetical protein